MQQLLEDDNIEKTILEFEAPDNQNYQGQDEVMNAAQAIRLENVVEN